MAEVERHHTYLIFFFFLKSNTRMGPTVKASHHIPTFVTISLALQTFQHLDPRLDVRKSLSFECSQTE